jgi:hypothetical protein
MQVDSVLHLKLIEPLNLYPVSVLNMQKAKVKVLD